MITLNYKKKPLKFYQFLLILVHIFFKVIKSSKIFSNSLSGIKHQILGKKDFQNFRFLTIIKQISFSTLQTTKNVAKFVVTEVACIFLNESNNNLKCAVQFFNRFFIGRPNLRLTYFRLDVSPFFNEIFIVATITKMSL